MAVIKDMVIKDLREYLCLNLYRRYTFTILGTRALFLRVIMETMILYTRRILRYIMRVMMIIFMMRTRTRL